ncbi:unnamed protein product, partial [Porites lobata]
VLSSESLLVTGDFNIHVDVVRDPYRAKFLELLETLGLQQHVIKPTHESGHTLIISRQCENLVKKTLVSDCHIPDHWTVTCLLNLGKPSVTRKTVTFKKTKGVNLAALGDRKKLFSVTNRLLGVERDTQYPPFKDKVVLNKIISLVIFSLRRLWSYKKSLITWLRQCRLAVRSSKSSLKPRLRNPARLTQCLRLLLSAALIFRCLLSPRSLISLYRRAHLLINGSVR